MTESETRTLLLKNKHCIPTVFTTRCLYTQHKIIIKRSPIATQFSMAWSVRLSVVCHNRAPCLNRSTDLDAIWQIHWGEAMAARAILNTPV